jgi:hypothetical protein
VLGKKRSEIMKKRITFGRQGLPESLVKKKKGGEGLRMALSEEDRAEP